MKRILSNLFAEQVNRLNNCFTELNSSAKSEPVFGYIHLLDRGNAIFITDERKPYLVSIEFTAFYKLKTGDRVQACTSFSPACNNYVVEQIVEVNHVAYDEAPVVKADTSFNLGGRKVDLGTSVLIPVDDNLDIANKVAKIQQALPENTVPVFLSFDGRKTNFNFEHSCFTKPDYTTREKLMACLLTFFECKQQADIGKDVVLIIDSLDKMFNVFNGCMQAAGTIDPNLFSAAAVIDFENIVCTSGNLKAGGSLTIIGLHRAGTTPQQLQITDRLHQILDQVITLK